MTRIYIITEATPQTGMGHLSRCSALYDAFREKGFSPTLIIDGGDGAHAFSDGRQAEYFDWTREPERIPPADIAVVDSYLAGPDIYGFIAGNSAQTVYIDDYARLDYPAGLVVNGAAGITPDFYKGRKNVLAGNRYIMLRREFWSVPARAVNHRVRKILVTMGGGDTDKLTREIVKLLTDNFPEVEPVIPRGVNAGRMKELMTECDIAVSAAGQTSCELARCGVPSLLIQTAANQDNNIKGWIEAGFIKRASTVESLVGDIKGLYGTDIRRKLSQAGLKAVDGNGARRVACAAVRALYLSRLTMRKAATHDLIPLFDLANDPKVRANSYNTAEIGFDEHRQWFSRVVSSAAHLLYIFEIGDNFAAQVRFEIKDGETVASISIAARYRGYGLATEMLRRALAGLDGELPIYPPVTAYIKKGNTTSQRAFAGAGFHNVSEEKWVKP